MLRILASLLVLALVAMPASAKDPYRYRDSVTSASADSWVVQDGCIETYVWVWVTDTLYRTEYRTERGRPSSEMDIYVSIWQEDECEDEVILRLSGRREIDFGSSDYVNFDRLSGAEAAIYGLELFDDTLKRIPSECELKECFPADEEPLYVADIHLTWEGTEESRDSFCVRQYNYEEEGSSYKSHDKERSVIAVVGGEFFVTPVGDSEFVEFPVEWRGQLSHSTFRSLSR